MTDAPHIEKFKEYYKTSDEMIAQSSKADLVECARHNIEKSDKID